MTTRSGTQYHSHDPTLEMEFALDNFTKLIERLTTRMDNMEQDLRNSRGRGTIDSVSDNGPHVGPRYPKINDQNDFAGANFKNIKLEAPSFDGQLDPQSFSIEFLTWTAILTGMICLTREGFGLLKSG